MTRRRYILVFALLLAACSAPDDPKPDAGVTPDSGRADMASDGIVLEAGVYNGNDASEDAALAVWSADDAVVGRLIAGNELGFGVSFEGDSRHDVSITPLDGFCADCGDGPWLVDIERLVGEAGFEYRFTVVEDAVGAGFDSLIMVPSDGFKPEFAPGEEFDVWTGDFVALAPGVSPAVLQSLCELSVGRQSGMIESFSCQDDDSAWSTEVVDSWAGDEETGAFETEAANFTGEFGGDANYSTFNGEIVVDGEVVGAFQMVKLTP